MILVDADRVGVSRPGRPLFTDLSFTVSTGDRWGIVGLNGCGKSTLLRVLAGQAEPEQGQIRKGRDVRIAMLDQRPVLAEGSVLAAVGDGWEAAAVLDRLGMGALTDADTRTLSGGQAKRVALARTLVAECDLLILDEPTNHLDIDAIAWLEDRLAGFRGGLILVTHDRHVLDRVTTKVLEIDRGRGYVHDGGYDAYLEGQAEREEQAQAAESSRRILARSELAWLRRGAKARSRKPKARIEAANRVIGTSAAAPARAGALDLSGAGPSVDVTGGGSGGAGDRGWGTAGVEKRYPGTPRLGDKVIDLHGIGHRYQSREGITADRGGAGRDEPAAPTARASAPTGVAADRDTSMGPADEGGGEPGRWLFRDLDLLLDNRERLGIVGPNGGGKSTLLDIIAGRKSPAAGTVERGPTVRLGYYDQIGTTLDLKMRVRDAVAGPARQADHSDSALLEQFWFDKDAQRAPIELLSGGERRRLQLLLVLAAKPNVLLLDEPTNDLDLDTLRVLEDFLDDWPGALVVVSHDRAFLERTVTDVLVIDGHGDARRQPGGYAAWDQQRRDARRQGGTKRSMANVSSAAAAETAPARGSKPAASGEPRPSSSSAGATESGSRKRPVPSGAERPTRPTRSVSTLRHLLKDTDKELTKLARRRDKLEAELVALTAVVADGTDLDHVTLTEVGERFAAATAAHEAIEERWLELADELETAQADVADRR